VLAGDPDCPVGRLDRGEEGDSVGAALHLGGGLLGFGALFHGGDLRFEIGDDLLGASADVDLGHVYAPVWFEAACRPAGTVPKVCRCSCCAAQSGSPTRHRRLRSVVPISPAKTRSCTVSREQQQVHQLSEPRPSEEQPAPPLATVSVALGGLQRRMCQP